MNLKEARIILGVDESSSLEEVKVAYHNEAQLIHPDKHQQSSENIRKHAESKFKSLLEAYNIIVQDLLSHQHQNPYTNQNSEFSTHEYTKETSSTAVNYTVSDAVIVFRSIGDVLDFRRRNPVAFDADIVLHPIIVRGKISDIDDVPNGYRVILNEMLGFETNKCTCYFHQNKETQVKNLDVSNKVRIIGLLNKPLDYSDIILTNCIVNFGYISSKTIAPTTKGRRILVQLFFALIFASIYYRFCR